MSNYLEIATQAAQAGGEVLRQWQGRIQAREKAPRDLVTEADLASQEEIRRVIQRAFPDHGFLGEEDDGHTDTANSPYRWIVDPLDGTTNYVHGLPLFSVSVALQCGRQVVAGAIYDPIRDDCYSAELGQGAFVGGKRLQTSDCRDVSQALTAASFSARIDRDSDELARFYAIVEAGRAVRRLGSAALNLCYVASGCLDAYFATSVKIWDIAAGILLVCEAGGCVGQLDGGPVDLENPRFSASATPELHRQILDALASAGSR